MIKGVLSLAILFGLCAQMAAAQTPITPLPAGLSFITSSGQGVVTASPDLAYVNTSVITNDANASSAIAANASAYQALRDRVQSSGVSAADIQQISYTVQNVPQPVGTPPPGYQGVRYGYTVSRAIRITVHDVARGQQVAEVVASSGASGYTTVAYSLSESTQRLQQQAALRMAVTQARDEAETAARAAGLHILRLHLLQVGQSYPTPIGYPTQALMAGAVTSSVSIPPAQVQVRASVTAAYVVSAH